MPERYTTIHLHPYLLFISETDTGEYLGDPGARWQHSKFVEMKALSRVGTNFKPARNDEEALEAARDVLKDEKVFVLDFGGEHVDLARISQTRELHALVKAKRRTFGKTKIYRCGSCRPSSYKRRWRR